MASAALELLIQLKDEASAGLGAIAGHLTSFGTLAAGGAVALTGAVVGIGAAAFDAASQVAQGANDMQAALGVTADRANELANLGEDIWANNWGGSIAEVNAALMETQKQFAGLGGIANDQAQTIVQSAFAISDTFGVDVNEAISAQRTLMEQFGVTSQQAADLVTTGFQQGLNSSDDFLDTIGEYSNQFAAGGASAEEFFSLMQSGMGSGVLGTDKAADAFKEFSVRILDGSTATAAGLQSLGLNVDDITAKINSGELSKADAFQMILEKLNATSDATTQWQAGVNLLGTQFEDLGPLIATNMTLAGDAFTNIGGATDSLSAKYNNWPSLWEGIKRSALDALLPLSSELLNLANQIMPVISAALPPIVAGITSFATSLSSGIQQAALLFAQLGAAFQQVQTYAQPLVDLIGANLMPILAAIGTVVGGVLLSGLLAAAGAFVALVAPIAGIVAGLALLYAAFNSNFLGIQTIVTTVLGAVLGIVQSVGAQIVAFWQSYGAQIMAAASAAWSGLQGLISGVLQGVVGVVVAIGGQIVAFWQQNGASIMATVQTTWAQLGTIISGAIQIITAIIQALAGVVSTVFSTIANFISQNTASIQAVLTGAWQVIQGVITAAMGIISGVIKTVLSAIQGDWRGVWEGLKTIVTSAVSGIGSILQGLGNIVRGALGVLGGIIKSVGESAISAATAVGSSIIDGIKKGISAGVGALKDAVKNAAQSALDAAKSLLQINSPSKVFANQVGIGIPEGIALGITNGAPAMTTKLLSSISDMASKAAKALEDGTKAIAAASAYSGAGGSGISGFLTDFAQLAIMFDAVGTALGSQLLNSATKFAETVGKVGGALTPAVEGMQALDGFVQPAQWSINNFGSGLISVVLMLVAATSSFETKSLDAAIKLTESIAKLLGIIEPGVKAFDALNNYTKPVDGQVKAFTGKLNWLVQQFVEAGQWLRGEGLAGAVTLAEGAYKILAVVSAGVEAFKDLNTYTKPIDGQVTAFTGKLNWLILQFVQAGAWLRGAGLAGAVALADAASKILSVISVGVAAFAALNTYVKPVDGSIAAFTGKIAWLVQQFVQAGNWLRGPALAAGVAFAEGAGKIVALIKPAVDGFAALPGLVAPTWDSTKAFADALLKVVGQLWLTARGLDVDAVAAAAAFAESAGKVIAILKNGVEGLNALRDLAPVAYAQVVIFGNALDSVVWMLYMVADDVGQKATDAAAKFADGAGKAVGMIGAASESMTKLKDFVAPAAATFAAFGASLRTALATLVQVMKSFTAEAIAAAGVFGDGAGKAVAFIGNAVAGFVKLAEFQGVGQAAISAFGVALRATLATLVSVMQSFSAEAVAAAGAFGEGAGKAIALIGSGVESITKLHDFESVPQSAILAFEDSLWRAFEEMVQVSEGWTAAAYAQATAFADGAGKAIAMIGTAVDSISKLAEFKAVPQKAILAFADSLWRAFEEMVQISEGWTAAAYAQATAFANGAGKAISLIGTAADGLSKLADFAAPAPKAIAVFGATLQAVLVELGAVAGVFSADAVAITATFATNVNTIVSQVKGALQSFATLGEAKVGGDVLKAFIASAQSLVAQMQAYLPPSAEIIGQNTVVGLINGIVSQRSALVTAMVNTVMAAVIAARQTLGIASPSKVFEQIGQYAGAGLQGGMAAMQPAIATAGAGLGMAAVGGAQPAARANSGAGAAGGLTVNIGAGAIVLNGVQGGITDKHLRALAAYIKEDIAAERGGR